MSMASLKEKVGIVTGGRQGIGKGSVKRLLEEGMSVVIAEMDEEAQIRTAVAAGKRETLGHPGFIRRNKFLDITHHICRIK